MPFLLRGIWVTSTIIAGPNANIVLVSVPLVAFAKKAPRKVNMAHKFGCHTSQTSSKESG
jgi:hypothetical protein